MADTNLRTVACDVQVGDLLYDPVKGGTHGQRIIVEWTGRHQHRKRTYVAGVEERSGNPVQLAYDNGETVQVFRA